MKQLSWSLIRRTWSEQWVTRPTTLEAACWEDGTVSSSWSVIREQRWAKFPQSCGMYWNSPFGMVKIFTYNLFYHPDKMLVRKMLPNVFIANMVFYSSELSNKFSTNLGSSKVGIESFSFGSAESHTTLDKMRAGLVILLMAEIHNNHLGWKPKNGK